MSQIKQIFAQSSHYFIGQVLLLIASFIAFPIITRILSVSEYGVLSLISSTFLLIGAIGKFGLQNASIRFFDQFTAHGDFGRSRIFYSTILFSQSFIAFFIVMIFFFIAKNYLFFINNSYGVFFPILICCIIFFQLLHNILINFLRSEQKTKLYNSLRILNRTVGLICSIFFYCFIIRGLNGFYIGILIPLLLITAFLLYAKIKRRLIDFGSISLRLLKKSVRYGFPFIWFELSALILFYADRFMLQIFLGSKEVGLYSAGSNFCVYISNLLIFPIQMAIVPHYMKIWNESGRAATQNFLSKTFRVILFLAFPLCFLVSILGRDIIGFLASSKYATAYTVIPYILGGTIFYQMYEIYAAGIFLYKKTFILPISVFTGCIINILLNLFFIPRYGIMGASLTTLISNVIVGILIFYYAFRLLDFKLSIKELLTCLLSSILIIPAVIFIRIDFHLLDIFIKSTLGIITYSISLVFLNYGIRKKLICFMARQVNF